jgi:hypothetical protein
LHFNRHKKAGRVSGQLHKLSQQSNDCLNRCRYPYFYWKFRASKNWLFDAITLEKENSLGKWEIIYIHFVELEK